MATDSALMTDLYELTMMAGYVAHNMHEQPACFDLFFRKNPFHGGYAVFAGLETALSYLEQLHFTADDISYLASLDLFNDRFLEYLREFRFHCTVLAPAEGTVVFANEPLLSVHGNLAEAQLIESALLNHLNFQTLIATKAARVNNAAGDAAVVEFGMRRAHGPDGCLSVARAAYIGGVRSTSNTLAGQVFSIPVKGTHAHSWVMAFPNELDAFRAYVQIFPDSAILLIDTYDTLTSGLPNALRVAQELRNEGHELRGVRLDSGDPVELSRKVRAAFDRAGFPLVRIVVSSELDEFAIQDIRNKGGQVDIYGVGTKLATGGGPGGGALGGVYKLSSYAGQPCMKTTSDPLKATLPGEKALYRLLDSADNSLLDIICLKDDPPQTGDRIFPLTPESQPLTVPKGEITDLRHTVMKNGRIISRLPSLQQSADHCAAQLRSIPEACLRLQNPAIYPVGISASLQQLRQETTHRYSCTLHGRNRDLIDSLENFSGNLLKDKA